MTYFWPVRSDWTITALFFCCFIWAFPLTSDIQYKRPTWPLAIRRQDEDLLPIHDINSFTAARWIIIFFRPITLEALRWFFLVQTLKVQSSEALVGPATGPTCSPQGRCRAGGGSACCAGWASGCVPGGGPWCALCSGSAPGCSSTAWFWSTGASCPTTAPTTRARGSYRGW